MKDLKSQKQANSTEIGLGSKLETNQLRGITHVVLETHISARAVTFFIS